MSTQYGFYIDSSRCTGCKTCELACKDFKNLSLRSISVVFMNMPVVIGPSKMVCIRKTFLLTTYLFHVTTVTIRLV